MWVTAIVISWSTTVLSIHYVHGGKFGTSFFRICRPRENRRSENLLTGLCGGIGYWKKWKVECWSEPQMVWLHRAKQFLIIPIRNIYYLEQSWPQSPSGLYNAWLQTEQFRLRYANSICTRRQSSHISIATYRPELSSSKMGLPENRQVINLIDIQGRQSYTRRLAGLIIT